MTRVQNNQKMPRKKRARGAPSPAKRKDGFGVVAATGAVATVAAAVVLSSRFLGAHASDSEGGATTKRRVLRNLTAYVSSVDIVSTYPHDTSGFTQGLCFDSSGRLVESDGHYGKSQVRVVEIETGESKLQTWNEHRDFGEGLTAIGDVLVQMTWRERSMIEYSADTLEVLRRVRQPLPREGWGAAYDARTNFLYLTDGTSTLRTFERKDGTYVKARDELTVRDPKLLNAVDGLNELEIVGDELWANVYPMRYHKASNCIARIDPANGKVKGWIDANKLVKTQSNRVRSQRTNYVLNGIAYKAGGDDEDDHLYLTGKQWDNMFDVDLTPRPELGIDHVKTHCDLHLSGDARPKSPSHRTHHHKQKHPHV